MASNEKVRQAILKTLLYSDIFDFPLTKDEIWRFLISENKISREDFEQNIKNLTETIILKNGFYSLYGKEQNILDRRKNFKEVHEKLQLARKAAFYISFIPTVQLIGISGGLALENAGKDDDIDFFIITQKNTLFMTRFWVIGLLEWLNLRRDRNAKNPANKICVNFLIDETRMSWPPGKRDLYIAHEIVQMQPLFERGDTYIKFMGSNKWIEKFLPNAQERIVKILGKNWQTNLYILRFLSNFLAVIKFELIIKKMQKFYMKNHLTSETVTNKVLAFHPNDYRTEIINTLRSKYDKIGLLTNF
ncbi:hypothetical protein HZA75_02650 [Candidatus Roizmanbacteria bacterium]|nr:hypothetical protein [Candidatus Roizmanbacteria bacterium]